MTARAALAMASLLVSAACVMPGQARRNAYDYGPLVAANPRSIVVAPILSPWQTQAGDWFLATLTAPLTERGYYVFPVFMSKAIAEQAGLARGPEGGFIAFSPEHAAALAAFFGADAVLFVTVEKWDMKAYELGLDPLSTNELLLDYRLTNAKGETIWTARQGASLTRGGGNAVAQVWNLFAAPSDDEIQTQLSREINRMAIEGRPIETGKQTFTRPPPLLVGPYHPVMFSFGGERKGVKPADIEGWDTPIWNPEAPTAKPSKKK